MPLINKNFVTAVDIISSSNSRSTPLLANESFTGEFEDCSRHTSIVVAAVTDQFSAIDGAMIEFSTDGTVAGINRTIKTTIVPNPDGLFFSVPAEAHYFRVSYTNGPVDQTVFNFQCILKINQAGLAAVPIVTEITDLTAGTLTRAILAGKSTITGDYENINTTDGRIRVESINVPAPISERFQEYAKNGASIEMNVNGSTTPVEFILNADPTEDIVVDFLTFQAFDNGIKIDKFLGENNELTNGIIVEVKSNDEIFQFKPIKNTTEFNSVFAKGPSRDFRLDFASGADAMVAIFGPASPFELKKQGTFGTDDYVKVIIQDNLSNITRLRFLVGGRKP